MGTHPCGQSGFNFAVTLPWPSGLSTCLSTGSCPQIRRCKERPSWLLTHALTISSAQLAVCLWHRALEYKVNIWFKCLSRLKSLFWKDIWLTAGICVVQLDVGVNICVWAGIHSYPKSQPPCCVSAAEIIQNGSLSLVTFWHLGSCFSRWHSGKNTDFKAVFLILPLSRWL